MKRAIFDSVLASKLRKNVFDLSQERKLTMSMGTLVPICAEPTLPGEKWKLSTESLIRLAPMVAPIMHRVNAYIHYWFVPNRLVWDNWKDFYTGGKDGTSTPEHPYLLIDEDTKLNTGTGTLADYFGLPDISAKTITTPMLVDALPFRAYQLIYNEYYRDQNFINEIPINKTDGVDPTTDITMSLRKRAWNRDYFNTALPFTQRGEDVLVPNTISLKQPAIATSAGAPAAYVGNLATTAADGKIKIGSAEVGIDNIDTLEISINDLRTSVRLQEYLEKLARAGSRYVEQLLAIWGVVSDDLQQSRPLYLGGNQQPIQISEVLAHFGSAEIPQGNMAGHGLSVGAGGGVSRYIKEHGWIIGIMSVLPRSAYTNQGIPKHFERKEDRYQYYIPDFAHLGEQPVKNQEIYFDPTTSASQNNDVWGYQVRYAQYRHNFDTTHGFFKTDLDYWTMARKFTTLPQLNGSFIECQPSTDIWADTTPNHKLYVQLFNHIKAVRPMPVFGTPKL